MAGQRGLGRLRAGIFTRLLIALLLVALLPLTAFWQLERQRMIDNGEVEAQERLQMFADRVVQRVDDWTNLNIAIMQVAADQAAMRSMRPRAQLRVIDRAKALLPWAYLIHTVDLTGTNVARSDRRPANWYGDRAYFRQILDGQPYAVEIQIGRTSLRPAFLMAVPIRGRDGQLAGMLIEAATLNHVSAVLTSPGLGTTGFAFLMTHHGRLIADGRLPLQHQLRDFSGHPAFRDSLLGNGLYHYDYDGIERVAEVRHTRYGWIAVAQQDMAENLAAVHQANRYALLLLGLTAALVTVLSALVARGFAVRIARATRALEAAKREAEAANRSKTSFVAAAVHDLMQPLNAARMFADAVRGRLPSNDDRELLDRINGALQAEDEILSTLLDISRLESGTIEVHEREFALDGLLETLGREFGILASARGIELRVARCSAVIRSDEALLRRILQNYLSNAVRYSRRGRALMGCRRRGHTLRIEVWDTGPGIPPEHQRSIFLEFQRLDTGQSTERGAGLGLAIVERIAKRLGHGIQLRSWMGRGSVFSVDVPLVAAQAVRPNSERLASPLELQSAPAQTARNRDGDTQLAGCRIWSVEDDPGVRQALHALLTGWGCDVTLCASRHEALMLAAASPAAPDLLLLDYRLTDGTGPRLVPELFEAWGAEVPVLVISAESDTSVRREIAAKGWAFLPKPISAPKLRALMTYLLTRSAASA